MRLNSETKESAADIVNKMEEEKLANMIYLYSDEKYTKLIDKKNLQDEDEFVVQGYAFKYQKDSNDFKCIRNITTTSALTALIKKLNLEDINYEIF